MLLRLQDYDFIVRYKFGREMVLVDGFFRLLNFNNSEQIDLDIKVSFVQFSIEKLKKF